MTSSAIGPILQGLKEMPYSVIAFGVSLVLGLFSMGILGAAIYYPVGWILQLKFAPLKSWHGDWVWPATIAAGMLWSVSFLVAGALNRFLVSQSNSPLQRGVSYAVVLWLGSLVVWFAVLSFAYTDKK